MTGKLGRKTGGNSRRGRAKGWAWMAALGVMLLLPGAASAQKNKKNQDKPIDPNATMPELDLPIQDLIDRNISEMLGAFQLGDLEKMHQYYADNATFVSGAFAPPVSGWANYAAGFQQERASFSGLQIVRRNTSIYHSGDVAWACYQWELSAQYAGKPYFARGQTTLVFVKSGGNWLIVHNHTSEICPYGNAQQQQARPAPANAPPAKP